MEKAFPCQRDGRVWTDGDLSGGNCRAVQRDVEYRDEGDRLHHMRDGRVADFWAMRCAWWTRSMQDVPRE